MQPFASNGISLNDVVISGEESKVVASEPAPCSRPVEEKSDAEKSALEEKVAAEKAAERARVEGAMKEQRASLEKRVAERTAIGTARREKAAAAAMAPTCRVPAPRRRRVIMSDESEGEDRGLEVALVPHAHGQKRDAEVADDGAEHSDSGSASKRVRVKDKDRRCSCEVCSLISYVWLCV